MKEQTKKSNIKLFMCICLTVIFTMGSALTVYAAPKDMGDGILFDAEFYAKQYPDVAEALGTDEAVLYQHYLTSGIKEGRLPYEGYGTELTTSKKTTTNKGKSTAKQTVTVSNDKTDTTTVYITPTGKKYHYSKACAGKNAIEKELSSVQKNYGPCKKCAQ